MATAILELFPETKLGHGPATDQGFFYDVYREQPFTDDDLAAIESRMAEVVARDEPFVREVEPRELGLEAYEQQGEFMKVHFIERFTQPGEEISLYRNGSFADFCRGPHVPSTGRVKAFKVMSVAGAYWLGDEKNQQLQRIYGTAFFNDKDLKAHFARLEEIKARDHRVLGKQLDLFSIQEVAGAGLIFWHPKGGLIRKTMEDWMREECIRRGYQMVYTPHIMRRELWKISGHEGFYGENMYPPMELDDAEYRLKPMNCPGHILIYKNTPKSYRDLPVRYAELGNVYRYERSGTMHGLLRVRGFTQDDAHIFCTPAQIEDEVVACIEFAEAVLNTFGFAEFKVELSTWDPSDARATSAAPKTGRLAIRSLKTHSTARASRTAPSRAKPPSTAPRSTSSSSTCSAASGSFPPCSSTSTCPRASTSPTRAKTASCTSPSWSTARSSAPSSASSASSSSTTPAPSPSGSRPCRSASSPSHEKHLSYAAKVKAALEAAGLRVELDARNEKMNAKIREFGLPKSPSSSSSATKKKPPNAVSVRTRGKGDEGQHRPGRLPVSVRQPHRVQKCRPVSVSAQAYCGTNAPYRCIWKTDNKVFCI